MDFAVIFGIWSAVATVAAVIFWNKSSRTAPVEPLSSGANKAAAALPAKAASTDAVAATEKKLAEARAELAQSKERLAARQKELDEMKEQAKLKARRDGKKEQRADSKEEAKGPDPRDVEIQSLRKGMAALEAQLNATKREVASTTSSSQELTAKTADEIAAAKRAADTESNRRRGLEDDNAALKKTLDELRNAMKKADARPDVPGTTLNLKELPTAAVQELSRYFRKGEEFERLYTVAQSQLQLEKDRYLELQRRYFAVCRELAVQSGLPANATEAELRKKAEDVIEIAAERLGERGNRGDNHNNGNNGNRERGQRQPQPQREPREPRPPREPEYQLDAEGKPVLGPDGQPLLKQRQPREPEYVLDADGKPVLGPDGQPMRKPREPQYVLDADGKPVLGPDGQPMRKKRRRRRRRKIAGEPSVAGGADEGSDDGDEGDDEGGDEPAAGAEAAKSDAGAQAPT